MILFSISLLFLIEFVTSDGYLMLTEVMFLPDGSLATENQFIELKNVGDEDFSFAGVALTGGLLVLFVFF